MKMTEAMKRADDLRDNTIEDEQKAAWLHECDCYAAEIVGTVLPENTWPEDRELIMPEPYTSVYVLYLMAMIDHMNGESALYFNDLTMYNAKMTEARAWWRRNNAPVSAGDWRV